MIPIFSVDALTLPIEVPMRRVTGPPGVAAPGLAARTRLTDKIAAVRGMDTYQQRAAPAPDIVRDAGRAFDIHAEDGGLRDRLGRTPYGQSVLLARQLVEAGVRFVTVYYSPGILVGWGTPHEQNFKLLRERASCRPSNT